MAFLLNEKLKGMTPYDPIQGNYPVRLDANESFLQPDSAMMKRFHEKLDRLALNRYPDPYALEVCSRFGAFYGVNPALVTATNGSDESISILMNAFLQKGDPVMTLSPDFSMYRFYASVVECPCLTLEKGTDFTIDVDQVVQAVQKEKVRLLIFSNPCNPTSVGLSAEKVRSLVSRVDALVVLDEAYMDFWDQSLLREVEDYENLIVLKTCSKAVGMAGIRLGFAVANAGLTHAIQAVKSPYNVNSVTQAFGSALFEKPEILRQNIQKIQASRDTLFHEIHQLEHLLPEKIQAVKPCANFVYCQIPKAKDVFDAMKGEGVIVRCMGSALRISAGSPDENQRLVELLKKYL